MDRLTAIETCNHCGRPVEHYEACCDWCGGREERRRPVRAVRRKRLAEPCPWQENAIRALEECLSDG